jgi:hypothetical protein
VSIAETMLPERLSSRLAPYLRYMPRLTRAQQAAAANLGTFPRAAEIGRDDPAIAAYAAAAARAAGADGGCTAGPERGAAGQPRRAPGRSPASARAAPQVAVQPQPAPPPAAAPAHPGGLACSCSGARTGATPRPRWWWRRLRPPRAQQGGPAVDRARARRRSPKSRRIWPRLSPTSPCRAQCRSDGWLGGYHHDPAPPRGAARGSSGAAAASGQPSRQWVQLATGRDEAALEFDWRRIKRCAGGLLDKYKPYVVDWGQTNRLVAGPFASAREAQEFVAAQGKAAQHLPLHQRQGKKCAAR